MSILGYSAFMVVSTVGTLFAALLESNSTFNKSLRRQLRLTGWLALGLAKKPVGWILGLGAAALARYHQGIAEYHRRRAWIPQHCGY